MKRLMATLAVVTALAISAVATAPAFAGSKTYGPVTVTCTESGGAATFTLEFKGYKISSPAIPHLTCPF